MCIIKAQWCMYKAPWCMFKLNQDISNANTVSGSHHSVVAVEVVQEASGCELSVCGEQ